MGKKIRVTIEVIPRKISDIVLAPRTKAIHIVSGRENKTTTGKVRDDAGIGVEALYPRLRFNILPEDFFLFGGEVLDSCFESSTPLVKSIFLDTPSSSELCGVSDDPKNAHNKNQIEIRVEAVPYESCSKPIRKENNNKTKTTKYKESFGGFFNKIKNILEKLSRIHFHLTIKLT